MRRAIVLLMTAAALIAAAVPAGAEPVESHYETENANAFWTTVTTGRLGARTTTTWYIGVYASNEGTWSDVYKEVVRCRPFLNGERCRTIEYLYGDTDLADGTFTLSRPGLESALLEGTYPMQRYDRRYRPTGEPVDTFVSALFDGIGEIQEDWGHSTTDAKCYSSEDTWSSAYRAADATGSVGDVDLGSTEDANIGWSDYTSVYEDKGCGGPVVIPEGETPRERSGIPPRPLPGGPVKDLSPLHR